MKKKIALMVIISFLVSFKGHVKDFGVHGHVFEILETDLLSQIEEKLAALEASGDLEVHQQKLLEKAQHKIENPSPVQGLKRAQTTRTFLYDPSITVPYDLKDDKGCVFQKAGTKVNPLTFKPLSKDLVFFDGREASQVQWVEATYLSTQRPAKLILVGGRPFELMTRWKKEVYFDQQGHLVSHFGLTAVPAFIRQKENFLEITEVGRDE